MVEKNKNIQRETDPEFQNVILGAANDLYELTNFYLVLNIENMTKSECSNAFVASALMRDVLTNSSKYFSPDINQDWISSTLDYAKKHDMLFEKAIEILPTPAQVICDNVKMCWINDDVAELSKILINYLWLYERYKTDNCEDAEKNFQRVKNDIHRVRGNIHKLLIATAKYVMDQTTITKYIQTANTRTQH